MQVLTTKPEMRRAVRQMRAAEHVGVGLVPTMGYLHDGHVALMRAAKAACDRVVVSIFVNPTQFGAGEDFDSYPRDTDRDLALLREEGVDAVFLPDADEMYAPDSQTVVETTELSRMLMGALRPGHFRGVATVVAKLFNIVQPDMAFFGRKDYQQLLVIRTLVRDLDMPVEVVGVPTVREPDGVAMSSRNVLLTPDQRAAAPALNAALDWAESHLPRDPHSAEELAAAVRARLANVDGAEVLSVDIRDADTLATVAGKITAPVVILLAVRFGKVTLIDQRVVAP
jgi:pantoate--beta-alanine ligase